MKVFNSKLIKITAKKKYKASFGSSIDRKNLLTDYKCINISWKLL
jgi:hypothetical protein